MAIRSGSRGLIRISFCLVIPSAAREPYHYQVLKVGVVRKAHVEKLLFCQRLSSLRGLVAIGLPHPLCGIRDFRKNHFTIAPYPSAASLVFMASASLRSVKGPTCTWKSGSPALLAMNTGYCFFCRAV